MNGDDAPVHLLPALLRACGRGAPSQETALAVAGAAARPDEWRRAAAVLASHRLLPLCGHALGEQILERAPTEFRESVRAEFRATFVRNFIAMRGLDDALAALRSEGIEPVVLKGGALVNTLYPTLATRPMVDLDLLVEEPERERAAAALLRLGWRRAAQEEDATNFVGADGLRIDLAHRFRVFEGRPRAEWTETVKPRFLASPRLVVLEPAAQLVHVVVHMNGHRRQVGHLLGWFVDAALVLREHAARLDRARLAPLLRDDEAWTWLVRTIAFAHDELGVASAAELARGLPDVPRLTLEEVLRSRRVHSAATSAARLAGRLLALAFGRRDGAADADAPALGDVVALAGDGVRERRARRVVGVWRRAHA